MKGTSFHRQESISAVREFEQTFLEEHLAHSTALQAVRAEKGSSYLVGPLARVNLNYNQLSAAARQAADDSGITWPCFNPYAGIVARAIELVHACEESLQHIDSYTEPDPPRLEYTIRAAEGCAATEAPGDCSIIVTASTIKGLYKALASFRRLAKTIDGLRTICACWFQECSSAPMRRLWMHAKGWCAITIPAFRARRMQ